MMHYLLTNQDMAYSSRYNYLCTGKMYKLGSGDGVVTVSKFVTCPMCKQHKTYIMLEISGTKL